MPSVFGPGSVRHRLPARRSAGRAQVRGLAGRLGWALALWLVAGCAVSSHEAELLSLSGVSPTELEPDGQLRIAGEGFPAGQPCHVTLRGQTRRPGRAPLAVSLRLRGRAVSPVSVAVTLGRPQLARLGGRGTFTGQVLVAFEGRAQGVQVVGRLTDQRIDLIRPFEHDMSEARRLRERALSVADFLGIGVDREAESHAGVLVAGADDDSRAARAGLSAGDRIVEADGVRVHDLSDLAPGPGRSDLRLSVRRPGQGTPVDIRLSLSGFESPALDASLRPLCAAVVCLLLVGVFFGPLPGPTPFVARCLSRYRQGQSLLSVRVWDDLPTRTEEPRPAGLWGRIRKHFGEWTMAALVTTLLLSIALSESAFGLRFNTLPMYLGLAALRLGVTLLVQPGLDVRARRALARSQLARTGVLAVTIAIACLHGGTRCLEGIVGSQGGVPWRWGLFAHPALMLVFPAFVLQGSRLIPTHLGSGVWARGVAYALDVGVRVLICAVGAAVFLGGWEVSGLGVAQGLAATLVGAGLFAGKAWAVALLLHFAKLSRAGLASPRWLSPGLCAGALAVAVTWIWAAPSEQPLLALGTVTFSTVAVALTVSCLRVLRADNPMAKTLSL